MKWIFSYLAVKRQQNKSLTLAQETEQGAKHKLISSWGVD